MRTSQSIYLAVVDLIKIELFKHDGVTITFIGWLSVNHMVKLKIHRIAFKSVEYITDYVLKDH